MFPNAKSVDVWGSWDGDKELKPLKKDFSKNIKIIKTPGHSEDSISFIVKTSEGIVSICGDVFWKKDYPKKDPYVVNSKLLEQSRKKILKISDYIVPGHADMYKIKK